jgi:hypothetical protein
MHAPKVPRDIDLDAKAVTFARRSVALAFSSGLSLSLLISTGLIAERLRAGSLNAALLINVLVFCCSLIVMTLTSRPLALRFAERAESGDVRGAMRLRVAPLLLVQALGALGGVTLAHAVLRHSGASALAWMCECPPQLVNDAVAVLGVFIAIWAFAARRAGIALLLGLFVLLLCYGATQAHWHVDRAPFAFKTTIQELVVGQVLAVATGLLAFRRFSLGRDAW